MVTVFERPADLLGREGTQLGPSEWLALTQEPTLVPIPAREPAAATA